MTWRKLGRVHVARGEQAWARTHAFCPTVSPTPDGRLRVYCAFLDAAKVGRVGFVDVNAEDPTRVVAVSQRPALDIGIAGAFDDSGVTPLAVCEASGVLRLYYAGWQLGTRVRYFLFTGLATSEDGGETFQRVSQVPVLDRSDGEPHVRTGGHVLRDGEGWRMWYAGGGEWVGTGKAAKPRYALRHLRSADGLTWGARGAVCLEPLGDDELGFGRPCILTEGRRLRMWPSVRTLSRGYRIGYAESVDGLIWTRDDGRAGIDVSSSGWDSEMVCFGSLAQTTTGTYLFYNGNNYGETGFGVAVAEGL